MITKDQAIEADEFHRQDCRKIVGSRGGVTVKVEVWRRNGRTRTWVTRPENWLIPVKHGLRDCGTICQFDAPSFHVVADCPLRKETDG